MRSQFSFRPMAAVVFSILILTGCATYSVKTEVVVDQDSTVKATDGKEFNVGKGQSFSLPENGSALIEAPGYHSVLVFGPRKASRQISLSLKPKPPSVGEPNDFWPSIDSLLDRIQKVETLLRAKKAKQALLVSDSLIQEFPKLARLKYLKASCLIVLGDREAADAILRAAAREELPAPRAGEAP